MGVESNFRINVDRNPMCSTVPSVCPGTLITSPIWNLFSSKIIIPEIKFLNKSCAPKATATPNSPKPAIIGPILIISAANFASAILIESGLSFLGIGTQPPVPSWGSMIKDNYQYIILGKEYLAIIPGLAIMLLVTSFMFLGNNLEEFFKSK